MIISVILSFFSYLQNIYIRVDLSVLGYFAYYFVIIMVASAFVLFSMVISVIFLFFPVRKNIYKAGFRYIWLLFVFFCGCFCFFRLLLPKLSLLFVISVFFCS